MSTRLLFSSLLSFTLLGGIQKAHASADSVIVFNEIHYHPADEVTETEWFELRSLMGVDVDISGWAIDRGVTFDFPEGTIVPGRGYLIIAADPANATLAGKNAMGPFGGQLSNNGEELRLVNNNGRVMDLVSYGDGGDWPTGADGTGVTLSKRVENSSDAEASNWVSSPTVGGTPGVVNFPSSGAGPTTSGLIDLDGEWKYYDAVSAPAGNWADDAFDDAAWASGDAGFYAGDVSNNGAGLDLLGYWKLDEFSGSTGANEVAGGQDAAVTGASWNLDGTRGRVLRFDGVGDFADAGTIPQQTTATDFTWSFWARSEEAASNDVIVGNRRSPNGADFSPREFIKFTANAFEWHRNAGDGGNIDYATIPQNTWQHHAVVKEGTSMTYYRDGIASGSSTISGGMNNPQPLYFGGDQATESWTGKLDDPAIWEAALPVESIAGLADGSFSPLTAPTTGGGGNLQTELSDAVDTHYFRKTFTYNGNPARTSLTLQMLLDDGAVVYLNGIEIHRENMPAGAISHGTDADTDVDQVVLGSGIALPASALLVGDNVLAIQVHQSSAAVDMVFAASLLATEQPLDPSALESQLVFSEISAATDANFRIEIQNTGSTAVDLAGHLVQTTGGGSYSLSAGTLAAGERLVLNQATLGFVPLDGERLSIFRPGGVELSDSRSVTDRLRGRDDEGGWMYPSSASFGAGNVFNVSKDVVINEIMYNPRPIRAEQQPPTVLLDWDATWRYNQAALDLGNDWELLSHPVGGDWFSGTAPIGFETSALPIALNTFIQRPVGKAVYFETDLTLTAAQLEGIEVVTMSHQIDDGAIFYLNGEEIDRYKMDDEPTTWESLANTGGEASLVAGLEIPVSKFVAGSNRLSVQVHQNTAGSSDIVFGLKLEAVPPFSPFEKSKDQWIELHNHSGLDVDISGWEFTDGISFTFPDTTTLAAGGFLLVARDAAELSSLYPSATIFGDWGGNLSRGGERLILRDASKNIVDEVRFFDGGRWTDKADGGGASLELRDPEADNNIAESWASSDEASRSTWQTYSYQASGANHQNDPTRYSEFLFGLLDNGEFLIDDISVIENPDGAARELIQNGDFSGGNANFWRLIGTHRHAEVIDDPDGGGKVLHMSTTGSTEHQHNNAGTTLKDGGNFVTINSGSTYEISFRAKWLSGSNQLHSRLYFNRAAKTTLLSTPDGGGTPGAANSQLVSNAGPTLAGLSHEPAVPAASESSTVTVQASDPDGVSALTLFYSVNGSAFASTAMSEIENGQWTGIVPGQSASSKIQFYVQAQDSSGAISQFPAGGPDSRAIIPVEDGQADLDFGDCQPNNLRIVMTNDDRDLLHTITNVMSNDRIACTVIWNESEVYYNCGVRLKGSERGRPIDLRVGFNLRFPTDNLFLGAHKTIAVDRSGSGNQFSQKEILVKHAINHAGGGIPGMEDDLIRIIAPKSVHTSSAMLLKSRYDSEWMNNMYENGSDGTAFEMEIVYYPTTTVGGDPEGLKLPAPDSVAQLGVRNLGSDKELYRWRWLIKNNRDADNYAPLMEMVGEYSQSANASYLEEMDRLLDVDQFLRSFAVQTLFGVGDSYATGGNHNAMFYQRAEDGKFLLFPWDMDFAFTLGSTSTMTPSGDLDKLLTSPANRRAYYGHVKDIVDTSFNSSYMSPWATHYSCFLPSENLSSFISYINTRSSYALGQVNSAVRQVAFGVTTPNGSTAESDFTIVGDGWVDVREIRLAGSDQALDVTWTDTNSWEVSVALASGLNNFTLEGYDFSGNLVGFDNISVTATGTTTLPSVDTLVVSEIYYNAPGSEEGAEYIEFLNIHPTNTLNISGLQIRGGITFNFPAQTSLAPGERVLVVANEDDFETAFGAGLPVAGAYTEALGNGGDTITIQLASGALVRTFSYSDDAPWPALADGDGASLVLAVPAAVPNHSLAESWRPSSVDGGTPGTDDSITLAEWKAGFGNPANDADPDGDGWSVLEEFVMGGSLIAPDQLGAQGSADVANQLISVSVALRAGAPVKVTLESSSDLATWTADPNAVFISRDRLTATTDEFTMTAPMTGDKRFYRYVFELVN